MRLFRRIFFSQLVRSSVLVLFASNLANFGNFLYNLSMGRLLGPKYYGDLGAIFSIYILFGVPLSILNLLLVKNISSYWGEKKYGEITAFSNYLRYRLFFIGLIISLLLFLLSPFFKHFLNLESIWPILLINFSFILSGPGILNRATLQGILSFSYLTFNSIVEVSLKLIISIVLVLLNLKLIGALLGPIIGGLVVYLLMIIELKFLLGEKKEVKVKISVKKLLRGFLPLFFATLTLSIFLNADIILVRHFFTAEQTGEYVALSTIGKIIFYAVGPIISVMFPIVSSRISGGLPYILPLFGTLIISLGISLILIISYFLFPKFIINFIFGSKYFGVIPFLGLFAFFMTIYTVNSILTHFLLSISYYKPISLLFLTSLLQVILIFLFHNSFLMIIWINILASLLYFFIASYFLWQKEKEVIMPIFQKVFTKTIYGR